MTLLAKRRTKLYLETAYSVYGLARTFNLVVIETVSRLYPDVVCVPSLKLRDLAVMRSDNASKPAEQQSEHSKTLKSAQQSLYQTQYMQDNDTIPCSVAAKSHSPIQKRI